MVSTPESLLPTIHIYNTCICSIISLFTVNRMDVE